ncbi:SUMF1/EgtB/PvdO family nonheme iron enzyme [Spirosoma aerolatum]|uniref:SUMF1/EgtB/PvdO family nonheme iron enzyme n=1 Tax=Spirosoma aerolatum TaxID=1211326 RepID=UPI0009ADB2E1|nr:SUMF1/EgtB/PvdO family nonheme iron enzyme [Spirosoma aerolatum]
MKNHNVLTLVIAFLLSCQTFAQTYNICEFGAKTDSTFLHTKAIQSAIDQCAGKGGGAVLVPAGTYYTGTIFLKANVYLHLSAGAVLQGSYNPADYPEHTILAAKKFGTITHNGLYRDYMKTLVIADRANNGPAQTRYPWGNTFDSTVVNTGQWAGATAVNCFDKGRTKQGLYDMSGNVWQLTERERSDGYNRFCMLRGGAWYVNRASEWYADQGAQDTCFGAKYLLTGPGSLCHGGVPVLVDEQVVNQ